MWLFISLYLSSTFNHNMKKLTKLIGLKKTEFDNAEYGTVGLESFFGALNSNITDSPGFATPE